MVAGPEGVQPTTDSGAEECHPEDVTEEDLDPSEVQVLVKTDHMTVVRFLRPLVRHFRVDPNRKID